MIHTSRNFFAVCLPILSGLLLIASIVSAAGSITFYGAVNNLTGSCHLLDTASEKLLLDCGSLMDPTEQTEDVRFAFNPTSIAHVVVSHSHLDHIGRLPALIRQGFTGSVFAAPPNRDLMRIMLAIQETIRRSSPSKSPIFQRWLDNVITRIYELPYETPHRLSDSSTLTLYPAGHILGSAMALIEYRAAGNTTKLLFTGDLGNESCAIVKRSAIVPEADYVVVEATYGGKNHNEFATELQQFHRVITETVKDAGVAIIPAYVLDRSQKVLAYIINGIHAGKIPRDVNIYLDSPSAGKILNLYESQIDQLAPDFIASDKYPGSPFDFPTLKRYRSFSRIKRPAIIIAPSADATAGLVVEHIKRFIGQQDCRIIFVSGYQGQDTLGSKLVAGAKELDIEGKVYPVKATTYVFESFSAHADQQQILRWLSNFKRLKSVYIVHGYREDSEKLAKAITSTFHWRTVVPVEGVTYTLE